MVIGVSIIRNRSGSRAAQTVPYRFPNSEFGAWTSVMDESRFFFPFHSTLVDHVLTDKRLHQGEKTGEEGREKEKRSPISSSPRCIFDLNCPWNAIPPAVCVRGIFYLRMLGNVCGPDISSSSLYRWLMQTFLKLCFRAPSLPQDELISRKSCVRFNGLSRRIPLLRVVSYELAKCSSVCEKGKQKIENRIERIRSN